MPQLHLITGHRCLNRSDAPVVLYCGTDADAAIKARETAINTGAVALADQYSPHNPVTRYADAAKVAAWQPAAAVERPADLTLADSKEDTHPHASKHRPRR